MDKVATAVGIVVVAVLAAVALGGLLCYFVMLLWNGCLLPAVDGVHEITWLQAWGLMILCGLLFKPHNTAKKD